VLCAPYFDQEVIGAKMLDRLAGALFSSDSAAPADVLYDAVTQELSVGPDSASLRLSIPFASKGEISLKQAGQELIVGVDGQRRTILLPPTLAGFRPTGATFEDGALEITFDGDRAAT
jgi:arsenite/tail-anchored protein-transporting ATPase